MASYKARLAAGQPERRIGDVGWESGSAQRVVSSQPGFNNSWGALDHLLRDFPATGAKIAVAIPPGQMALTLIPRSASSNATDFVNPTTPNFAAE